MNNHSQLDAPRKFGTFGGVFTPNVLTILGVILFLRAGWVVGQAGLKHSLTILIIANSITLLTALSLSAIATNTKVRGGGAYYLISRSLGLEVGGSIGLPLYLAQTIAVAFYVIGFAESLQLLWPGVEMKLTAVVVLVALFLIAWLGADLAIKTQYLILTLLALSLVSFFVGHAPLTEWVARWSELENPPLDRITWWQPDYRDGLTFWSVFAIYFPAVTGIMSGVSMSGDLRNPNRSIPRGTMWAVIVTFFIYAAQMLWLALNVPRDQLRLDNLAMMRIAIIPDLIFVGLWAAALSSGLASLVAAPRTLQALGVDGVLPRFLARGYGKENEPRLALILTLLIAGFCIWTADLDLLAPVITMFFLTTYGMVNLAAGLERWVANPSYRPTFKVHWALSLVGALGCVFVMFVLNALATLLATLFMAGIYMLLTRRRYQTAWGDVRSGFWFAVTRLGLLQLSRARPHLRNWRPVLLVLVGNPKSRLRLVEFANAFECRRGLLFLAQIVSGDWQRLLPRQAGLQQTLQDFIRDNRLSAVAKTVMADDFEHGVSTLLQVAGLGPVQPNTVLLGWSDDEIKQQVFARTVRRILQLEKNLLIFAEAELPQRQLQRHVDVWWRAKENGSLMVTLAHLLRPNTEWRRHRIRVLRIIPEEAGRAEAEAALRKLMADARFRVTVQIIVSRDEPLEVIARESEFSAVCFVGMAIHALADQEKPLADYAPLVTRLKGDIFLTKSWHDLEL